MKYPILALSFGLMACAEPLTVDQSRSPIINGTQTSAYPAVGMISVDGGTCSATVIGEYTVLTAAHCVDASSFEGMIHFGTNGFEPERSLYIQEIVRQRGYVSNLDDAYQGHLPNDIALLRLSEPAGVAPVRINDRDLRELVELPATSRAVGYGFFRLNDYALFGLKRYADFQVQFVTPHALVLSDDDVAICFGDSGGPHLVEVDGEDVIVGVSSLMRGQCTPESLHTRVDPHAASFVYPYMDSWEGPCRLDGACVTDGCRTPNPDCAPCGVDGICTPDCPQVDLDCPLGRVFRETCTDDLDCESRLCTPGPSGNFCSATCDPAAPAVCSAPMQCGAVEGRDAPVCHLPAATTDEEAEDTGGCSIGGRPAAGGAWLVPLLLASFTIRRGRRGQRAGLLVALVLAACGAEAEEAVEGPSAPPRPMPAPPADDGDHDTFETAAALPLGAGAEGVIQTPGDVDYYEFTAEAGEWLRITTRGAHAEVATGINLYETWGDEHYPVASNGPSYPDHDAELIFRVPRTGTYFVDVQHRTTWSNGFYEPIGDDTMVYRLRRERLVSGNGIFIDRDRPHGKPLQVALPATGEVLLLGAAPFANADRDTFEVTLPAGAAAVQALGMASGEYGNGSSSWDFMATRRGGVRETSRRVSQGELFVPAAPGEVVSLEVGNDEEFGGNYNPFYVIKLRAASGFAEETDDTANDLPAGAETLDMPGARSTGTFVTRLPTLTDVDHWSFSAEAQQEIVIRCGGVGIGSGVQGMTFELLGPSGEPLDAVVLDEHDYDEESTWGRTIDVAGTFQVRLTKQQQATDVASDLVRCKVTLRDPIPSF